MIAVTLGRMGRRGGIGQVIHAARTARRWTQSALAERAGCDQSTVSRVERDRTADPDTVCALAAALDLPLERVGFVDLPEESADRLAHLSQLPRSVDAPAVSALADMLAVRRRAEDTIGAAPMVRPVLADLDLVRDLDRHAVRDTVRAALGGLAAEHAQFLGWISADAGDLGDAARWYGRALDWATSPAMITSVLSMSSHLAATRREPSDALALAEAGWAHASKVSPGVLALLAQQQARCHAVLGDRPATDRLLARAAMLTARAAERPDDEPPWTYFNAPARLLMQRGVAYTALGLGGEAVGLIRACIDALPQSMQRDRGWHLARLAHAHAVAGDVHEAASTAGQAARIATGTASAHTWREIASARRRLDPWDREPAVRALDVLLHPLGAARPP